MAQDSPAQAAIAQPERAQPKREPGKRKSRKRGDRRSRSTPRSLIERDASDYIGWSVGWLRDRRRHGGGPPFIRVNRAVRYRVDDLDAWLAAHRVEPRGPEAA